MSKSQNASSKKLLERDLWVAGEHEDPANILYPTSGLLCRMLLFCLVSVVALVGAIVAYSLVEQSPSFYTIGDNIKFLDVSNCYVTMDPLSLRTTNHVDKYDSGGVTYLNGRDSGLCSVRIKIPPTRTLPLTIRATASTLILGDTTSGGVSYGFVMEVVAVDEALGTLRVQVGGAAFVGMNMTVPSGILVVDTSRKLPTHINARLDWGVVAIPWNTVAVPPQKTYFQANVSLGGYCIQTGQPTVSYSFYDDLTWNNTIVTGSVHQSTTGVSAISTLTVNATSMYLTSAATSTKLAGPLMNETQKIRPYVERQLIDTPTWLSTQTNKKYVAAVDVVAPYAGALFLNTNGAFMLEFGVELLSLLSGFMLTPSYRRFNSALNHYQCSDYNTVITSLSVGVLMSPFNAESVGVQTVDASTQVFISDNTIAEIYDSIQNNTFGTATMTAVGLVSLELTRKVRPDTTLYSIAPALDGSVRKTKIKRGPGQWALFAFSIAIGMYVAIGGFALLIFYRYDLLRSLYLHSSRAFVREATQMRGTKKCPYSLYLSLYSMHALLAFHLTRLATYVVYSSLQTRQGQEFAQWVLKICDAQGDDAGEAAGEVSTSAAALQKAKPRNIPVSYLVEKYAQYWATRYMPRIDLPRAKFIRVLQEAGCKVATVALPTVVGVAPVAMNTERGGTYVYNELYRTTNTDFDIVPAAAVSCELFCNNPLVKTSEYSVVEEAEALLLTVGDTNEPTVTNATFSSVWLLETTSSSQVERAEESFGSFPAMMEVRPAMDWPEIPPEGYGAVRQEIKLYLAQGAKRWALGFGQGIMHVAVLVAPFVIATALMSMYVHESVKYSVSTDFLDGYEVFLGFSTFTVNLLSVQNVLTLVTLCFLAFATLEPVILISFRLATRRVSLGEKIVLYPITGIATFCWTVGMIVFVAYVMNVLIWWILSAIVAPETMLAFASSAICLLGALGATYRSVISSRDAIVGRVKDRILEFLTDFLRKSGVNVDSPGANSMFGVEGISVDLLLDVADGDDAALEKLATILGLPPPLLTSANAVQAKDPKRMRESTEALLSLCDVPKKFQEPLFQILLRACRIPTPMTALTHSLYELHPDKDVRKLLRKKDAVITPSLEAVLSGDLMDMSKVTNAIVTIGTEFLVDESLRFANKKVQEEAAKYGGSVGIATEDMVITRSQCKAVIDWARSAMSSAKQYVNSDGSVVDDAASAMRSAARKHKMVLGKMKELLVEVSPLLSEDQETIAQILIGAIELCFGGDRSYFTNALLNAGSDLFLDAANLFPENKDGEGEGNFDILLFIYTISEIDPVFRNFMLVKMRDQLEWAGVDVAGAGDATKASEDPFGMNDDSDSDDDDSDYGDDDDDGEEEEEEEEAAVEQEGERSASVAKSPKRNPRAWLGLVEHIVKLLCGVMKLTSEVAEQRTVSTMLQVVFSEPADAVKLIDVLGLQAGGVDDGKLDAKKCFDDAKKIVELFVKSCITDGGKVTAETRDFVHKHRHPLSQWLAYHWILLAQVVMPSFPVSDSVKAAFAPNYKKLSDVTDVTKESLGAFEHAAELAIYISNLIADQLSSAIGISASDIFDMVQGAVGSLNKLLPAAAGHADGLFGNAKGVLSKVLPVEVVGGGGGNLLAKPGQIIAGAKNATSAQSQLQLKQQAVSAGTDMATAAITKFPSLLFRILRGAAPSFGGGGRGSSSLSTEEVEEAKNGGSFSLSMLTASADSLGDEMMKLPFMRVAKTLWENLGKIGKLIMTTIMSSARMPKSLLSDTTELFQDMGRSIIKQVFSSQPADVREVCGEFMSLMTQGHHATSEQLNRLAKHMGVSPAQINVLFYPCKNMVEQQCPWAAFLYRLASPKTKFSVNDPLFKSFIDKNKSGVVPIPLGDGDNSSKKLDINQYVAHFAPVVDKTGKVADYVEFIDPSVASSAFDDDDGDAENADWDNWPEMRKYPLRYPAANPAFQERRKKNALLFCVLVGAHPLCTEAVYCWDMLNAFRDFFNRLVWWSEDGVASDGKATALKMGDDGYVKGPTLVLDTAKDAEAAAAAAPAPAPAPQDDFNNNNNAPDADNYGGVAADPINTNFQGGDDHGGAPAADDGSGGGGGGGAAAAAAPSPAPAPTSAAEQTVGLPSARITFVLQCWHLLMDMVLSTMPVLASVVMDRNMRDNKSTKDWIETLEIFTEIMHGANILESPKVAVDDEGQIKEFQLTKAFEEWLKIAQAGNGPKANISDSQREKRLEKKKGNKYKRFRKASDGPEDPMHNKLWTAMGTANPFLIYYDYDEYMTTKWAPALVFFNRCHGMPDVAIDPYFFSQWSPDPSSMEHKAMGKMDEISAFCTLLVRRGDLPVSQFKTLLKRVPTQFSRIMEDLLQLRCGGVPYLGDAKTGLATTLASFPTLGKEFKRLNLDQVGKHVVDFFCLLHGKTTGFIMANALGGVQSLSGAADELLARKKAATKAVSAQAKNAAKTGVSSTAAAAGQATASANNSASAAAAAAHQQQPTQGAAAAASTTTTTKAKTKAKSALAELTDTTVLKRFAQLIVRGDALSLATAGILHAMKLFKEALGEDFSFMKSLLLVMFAADELDISKLTRDAKDKARKIRRDALKALAKQRKRAAKAAAEAGDGTDADKLQQGAAGLISALHDAAAGSEDSGEWTEEEYWDEEEVEVEDEEAEETEDGERPMKKVAVRVRQTRRVRKDGGATATAADGEENDGDQQQQGDDDSSAKQQQQQQQPVQNPNDPDIPDDLSDDSDDSEEDANDLLGIDIQIPSAEDMVGYSPFLCALIDHVTKGGLTTAAQTFDSSLQPLLSVLRNPTQALMDMCPFGEGSKEWHGMCLAMALVQQDWDTAMVCTEKLVVALDADPGIQKLVNIIMRAASTAMSQKDDDKVAAAKDICCDVLDLAGDVDKFQPYKPVFTVSQRLLREQPLEQDHYQGLIRFSGEVVLPQFLDGDKVEMVTEFVNDMHNLFTVLNSSGGMAMLTSGGAGDDFDLMSIIEALLSCDLLVPDEHRAAVEQFATVFSEQIVPMRRKAARMLREGETAQTLIAKVELPMLMELCKFAARFAEDDLPDDVPEKINLVSRVLSGDFAALGGVLQAIGIEVSDEVLAVLTRVLNLVKTLSEHKGLGKGGLGEISAKSFINALTDFVFDQFSNGGETISFNSMVALLNRLHISMPSAEAKALFSECDADNSGAIDREEFKVLIAKLQDLLFNRVLDIMGMSPSQLIIVLVALGVNLVMVLAFLLLGVRVFADGTAFTASTSAMLPFFATALSKLEGTVDQLMQQADRAVAELMKILNAAEDA